MKVLMNHIYELHKGVRHMVLFTCNKKYSELAIQRLESQGIPYLLQPAGQQNLNVYFGRRECLEAIRLIITRPLNQLTPEEDFILGAMLGNRYNPNQDETLQKEIESGLSRMLAIRFDIEHLTGKEAIELVRQHQNYD